jgi:MYXO-CTERM domain-containing protein
MALPPRILAALTVLGSTVGCKAEQDFTELSQRLSTSLATFDAGIVPIDGRETLAIFLASTGSGEVEIYDVYVDDPDHWEITDSWRAEGGIVESGSPNSPGYGRVDVLFKPDAEDFYRTTLTIVSSDNEVQEQNEEGHGIWRVVLRGIGRDPCGQLYPASHDFGPRPAGGYFSTSITVQNCGRLTLTVADFDIEGSGSFSVQTPTPLYVLPGDTDVIELAYEPDGSASPASATVTMDTDAPGLASTPISLRGNLCDESGHPAWDADNDGWTSCGGDCDDTNPGVHPGAVERPDNSIDDDCDGEEGEPPDDSTADLDGDGISISEGDCLDSDPTIYPGAEELPNQIDDDCDGFIDDGTELYDDDGDGLSEVDGDCNDRDVLIGPGAEENGTNGIDDDCDGLIDEGSTVFDDDGDGFAEYEGGVEVDCNDDDPWVSPERVEDCDGVDNDCDGVVDEGEDGRADGACAFLVERQAVDAELAAAEEEGCASAPGPRSWMLVWLALSALVFGRRRT